MAKLGMVVMSIIAAAVTATSCGKGDTPLLSETTARPEVVAASDSAPVQNGYADVNGVRMYFEVYGQGAPVLLLHGAYMSANAMKPVTEVLARTRRVIVPEAQGHARTADIDRPITYEAMADDAAALLDHLQIQQADVVGYSMGGGTALQLAIRHPEKVKRLVAASASYTAAGVYPEVLAMFPSITPEMFAGSPMETEYKRLSPTPEKFPDFVAKLKALDNPPPTWPASAIKGIKAPTLLVIGDQDVVTPEHAVEMLRLLGGGVPGDMGAPAPEDQLAILPGTTHIGVLDASAQLFAQIVVKFLDPPPAQASIAPPPPETKPQ